jgi:hypothetical protein
MDSFKELALLILKLSDVGVAKTELLIQASRHW